MSNEQKIEIGIQRLYIKDISFESPQAPKVFTSASQPKIQLNLTTSHKKLQETLFEVSLTVTATAENNEGVLFIAEVEQAGVFSISPASGDKLQHILGAYCPNILFPYVRETIDMLTTKGSFPPLMLAPVNFEGLLMQQKNQAKVETPNNR